MPYNIKQYELSYPECISHNICLLLYHMDILQPKRFTFIVAILCTQKCIRTSKPVKITHPTGQEKCRMSFGHLNNRHAQAGGRKPHSRFQAQNILKQSENISFRTEKKVTYFENMFFLSHRLSMYAEEGVFLIPTQTKVKTVLLKLLIQPRDFRRRSFFQLKFLSKQENIQVLILRKKNRGDTSTQVTSMQCRLRKESLKPR